ncbi:TRAP transporter large permease subunit [Vibrio lentus]|nr:TRAP transporter large permease subunit [Vibrio lentus]
MYQLYLVWVCFGSTQATVVSVGRHASEVTASGLQRRLCRWRWNHPNASMTIAFLIPPNIGLILCGTLASMVLGELFIASIGPGLVLAGLFSLYSYAYSVKPWRHHRTRLKSQHRKNALKRSRKRFFLLVPCFDYGGNIQCCTPTEAASFAVLAAIIVECILSQTWR